MDKKSKILLGVVFFLIIASVGATYWRIFVKKDYVIENQIDCDPSAEKCFIWECDPVSTVEGEACTGNPEADIWFFKIARRSAANIPMCDPEIDETCDLWTCEENEKDCDETLCDETNKEEMESECNDPVQYAINNPVNPVEEEDAVECGEGDEECSEEVAECGLEAEDCAADVTDSAVENADDAEDPTI